MSLTPTQEAQIIDILGFYSETLDLGAAATQILAALGYGDVRVIDLPTAAPLNGTETFYVAQTAADVKATIQQFAQYTFDTFIDPVLDAALQDLQDQLDAFLLAAQAQIDASLAAANAEIDAAIAAMQTSVNQSINQPRQYFVGQF